MNGKLRLEERRWLENKTQFKWKTIEQHDTTASGKWKKMRWRFDSTWLLGEVAVQMYGLFQTAKHFRNKYKTKTRSKSKILHSPPSEFTQINYDALAIIQQNWRTGLTRKEHHGMKGELMTRKNWTSRNWQILLVWQMKSSLTNQ